MGDAEIGLVEFVDDHLANFLCAANKHADCSAPTKTWFGLRLQWVAPFRSGQFVNIRWPRAGGQARRIFLKSRRRGYSQMSFMGMIGLSTGHFFPRPAVCPTLLQLAAL